MGGTYLGGVLQSLISVITDIPVLLHMEQETNQGRMDTCKRMAEALRCSPATITTLLIGYTPIHNKKFFLKKRKKQTKEPNYF